MSGNVLYYGDNLDILHEHVADESVDLIYLDPPFNSNRNYEVFWGETKEKRASKIVTPAPKPTSTTCGPAAPNSPASFSRKRKTRRPSTPSSAPSRLHHPMPTPRRS